MVRTEGKATPTRGGSTLFWWLVLVAAVGATLATFVLLSNARTSRKAERPTAEEEIMRGRGTEPLPAAVPRLSSAQMGMEMRPAPTPAPPVLGTNRNPMAPDTFASRARAADDRIDQLVTAVGTEARDPSWARDSELQIRDTLQKKLIAVIKDASIESVRCGSTRCVVQVDASSAQGLRIASRELTKLPGLERGTIRRIEKPGAEPTIVAVVARTGYDVDGRRME